VRRLVVAALSLVAAIIPATATPAAPPIQIRTELPPWLAPGGRLTVSGFAASHVRVVLRAGGRTIATVVSGSLGRFDFHVRARGAGRYPLSVRAGTATRALGTLTVRPLELAAVGDVTPGEQVGPAVLAYGAAFPWSDVGALLAGADLTTANLEGAITARGIAAPDKQYHFRGPVGLLTGARATAGIDVLTLANNHSLDYGEFGLRDTLAAAARSGIATVGAGVTSGAARRRSLFKAGGLRIAFLGYSDVNPLGFTATGSTPGTAAASPDAIASDVRAARRVADVVVCWFHWGIELHATPTAQQLSLAATALNAGAQVVLGAHPHVFGAIARPSSTTLVAWTLGNFVFPAGGGAATRSGVLLVGLGAHGVLNSHVVPALSGVRPTLLPR
jgi:poly-gamma-glutamate capsule biosynthesis protein CapA/YwtB (metallophosphatase superfamily)